jgi:hypothetical protein
MAESTRLLLLITDLLSTLANNPLLTRDSPGSPATQGWQSAESGSPVLPALFGSLTKLTVSMLSVGLKVLRQEDRISVLENRLFSAVETKANALSDLRLILVSMEYGFIRQECDIYERIAVAEATLSNLGSQCSGLKERFTTKIDSVGDEMRELRLLQGNSVLAMQKNSGSGQRRVQF